MAKIFESPDRGRTVYARESGSLERELVYENTFDEAYYEGVRELMEDQHWREIRKAAKDNKALQNALEECIIIYNLSKEYKDV